MTEHQPSETGRLDLFWNQAYTVDSITDLLVQHGFRVLGVWADQTGTSVTPDAPALGVVAERI